MIEFNDKKFFKLFPKDVYEVCTQISREGFCLTLVGGAVRDFLSREEISKDLDFEIKHLFEYDEEKWLRMLKRLFDKLQKSHGLQFEDLGVGVFKTHIGEFEVEFSSPRLEAFDSGKGHKNFTPNFVSNLSYEEAFKRRDFTLNAMGIFFGVCGANDEFKLIDPFNGLIDLNKGELRNINENFFKDYVRLLRLIRFKNLYNLNISKSLEEGLGKFNLDSCSPFYLLKESSKCSREIFFKDIFLVIDQYKINHNIENLRTLSRPLEINSIIELRNNSYLEYFLLSSDLSIDIKKNICEYFSYSQKKMKKYHSICTWLEEFDSPATRVKCVDALIKLSNDFELNSFLKNNVDKIIQEYSKLDFTSVKDITNRKDQAVSTLNWAKNS